ncbi:MULTISPECIES: hypothetical protein [unclassified Sphingomonas]|nr:MULTISPECIES: hypothetical protein [unclassified Sphingomonas]
MNVRTDTAAPHGAGLYDAGTQDFLSSRVDGRQRPDPCRLTVALQGVR